MLFVMLYLKDGSLKKEFRMYWFISLLNVCFKIFLQEISNAKGEKEGGNKG